MTPSTADIEVPETAYQAGQVLHSILTRACRAGRKGAPRPSKVVDRADRERLRNVIEKHWIGLLHVAFEEAYPSPPHRVLSTSKPDKDFGLNQYLFDLTVIRLRVPGRESLVRRKILPVIQQAVWQVESEMAANGRAVAIDLGKLVCGSGRNKLLIARRPKGWGQSVEGTNDFILDLAKGCVGNFFVAYIPSYASKNKQEQAHHFDSEHSLPFELYARTCTGTTSELLKIGASSGQS